MIDLMVFQSEISIVEFFQRNVDGKHLMPFRYETYIFEFQQRSVDGKHLMRFRSETCVFEFLQRSVDNAFRCRHNVYRFLRCWNCYYNWLHDVNLRPVLKCAVNYTRS